MNKLINIKDFETKSTDLSKKFWALELEFSEMADRYGCSRTDICKDISLLSEFDKERLLWILEAQSALLEISDERLESYPSGKIIPFTKRKIRIKS